MRITHRDSGHHTPQVCLSAVLHCILPEPIHCLALAGNSAGLWRNTSLHRDLPAGVWGFGTKESKGRIESERRVPSEEADCGVLFKEFSSCIVAWISVFHLNCWNARVQVTTKLKPVCETVCMWSFKLFNYFGCDELSVPTLSPHADFSRSVKFDRWTYFLRPLFWVYFIFWTGLREQVFAGWNQNKCKVGKSNLICESGGTSKLEKKGNH